MSAKLVLYFTAGGRELYRWQGGALELEARFTPDPEGLGDFRARLKGRQGALVYVLADLAGEDFQEDQIPYLRGGDRESVVQRRLAQRYRDTRLATALSLGQMSGERRSERLLLASFTNPEQFTDWLDALGEAGARLSGVYSVPLLAPALAQRLGVRGGRALIVTLNRTGLRQCYIDEGRLRFARLERTPDAAPDALAAFVRAETLRLVQFLATRGALPRDSSPIQVIVIASATQRTAFEQALVSDERCAFRTVASEEAARKTGIRGPIGERSGERLFLQLMVKQPPKEQFARLEDRRSFFVWRVQRTLVRAGAIGFAACALYAVVELKELMDLNEQIALQRGEAQTARQQYQRITASFPVTQTTTDNLKATVVEFSKIAAHSASPEPALVYLSQVLDKHPQLEIDSIQWRIAKPGGRDEAGAAKPASTGRGASADAAAGELQMIEVSGRVNAIRRSDYRAITGQVQKFAEALRVDPAWRILRMQLPFDVTPEGVLSGDIGSAESSEAPKFSVTVGRALQ